MKTELITPTDKQAEIKYPVLARHRSYGFVVMFTAEKQGMVVCDGMNEMGRPVGAYEHNNWVSITDSIWQILPAGTQLILTQE